MKVHRAFEPIILTIESEVEACFFWHVLNKNDSTSSYCKDSKLDETDFRKFQSCFFNGLNDKFKPE